MMAVLRNAKPHNRAPSPDTTPSAGVELQAVIQQTPAGLAIVDNDGRIIEWNPALEQLTGYSFDEVRGRQIWVLHSLFSDDEESAPRFNEQNVRRVLRDGPLTTAGQPIKALVRHKDGTPRWMSMVPFPIHAQDGHYLGAIIQDITAQRQAEVQLELQARRAEAVARLASRLSQDLNIEQILAVACQEITRAIGISATIAQQYDPAQDAMLVKTLFAGQDLPNDPALYQPISRRRFLEMRERYGDIIIIPDARQVPGLVASDIQQVIDIRTIGVIGLEYEGELLGAITLLNLDTVKTIAEEDLSLLRTFANQVSEVIAHARLFEQVRSGRERLYKLSQKLVEVQEAERRMIAHELHDQIGQELTAMNLTLDLCKGLQGEELAQMLAEAQALAGNLMDEIRELSLRLRPSTLDDLGLEPALAGFFKRFTRQTGIQVHAQFTGLDRRFSAAVETAAFRIAQEALTNIGRYAGVRDACVTVCYQQGELILTIQDHGRGFSLDFLNDRDRAFGINGMQERATLVGGYFDIQSQPGAGTTIQAVLPVEHPVERRRHDR